MDHKPVHFRLIDTGHCPILPVTRQLQAGFPLWVRRRAGGMMAFSTLRDKRERGFLDGQLLIAMPGMQDSNFARSVVYVCAHSAAGAMGFIINRPQEISFTEVLQHLKLFDQADIVMLPGKTRELPILSGGPVESGRGFVLHSDDFGSESSIPVSDDISLTATLDIIRAICEGRGPARATMLLGYAGWGPGQLELEISSNGWLNCPAREDLIFDRDVEGKYDRALASMGISPEMLSSEAGHA
jgi:putative transcriptional regulator